MSSTKFLAVVAQQVIMAVLLCSPQCSTSADNGSLCLDGHGSSAAHCPGQRAPCMVGPVGPARETAKSMYGNCRSDSLQGFLATGFVDDSLVGVGTRVPVCSTSTPVHSLPLTIGTGATDCYIVKSTLSGGDIIIETNNLSKDVVIDLNGQILTSNVILKGNNNNNPNGPTVYITSSNGHVGVIQGKIKSEDGAASASYYKIDASNLMLTDGVNISSYGEYSNGLSLANTITMSNCKVGAFTISSSSAFSYEAHSDGNIITMSDCNLSDAFTISSSLSVSSPANAFTSSHSNTITMSKCSLRAFTISSSSSSGSKVQLNADSSNNTINMSSCNLLGAFTISCSGIGSGINNHNFHASDSNAITMSDCNLSDFVITSSSSFISTYRTDFATSSRFNAITMSHCSLDAFTISSSIAHASRSSYTTPSSILQSNTIAMSNCNILGIAFGATNNSDLSNFNNLITIDAGSNVRGTIDVSQNITTKVTVQNNSVVEGSILGGNFGNSIALSNNAVVVGNIVTGDGNDTLSMKNSVLLGSYDLGGGHNIVTIDNSFAYACPHCQTYTVPFVELARCKDDAIGNTIFYGDGTSIYACLGGKTLAYPIVDAPGKYYNNQAFYWMNPEGDKPRNALIAIALGNQVLLKEYVPSPDGSLGAFFDAGSFVPQADFHVSQPQVYGVAWHVGLAGQDWDPAQQYLAVSFLSEIPVAPGPTDYATTNYIDIYKVDTSSSPYKAQYIARWNVAPDDNLSHPVSYLTWQPATGFGSNTLVVLGVSPLDGAIIAVPIIGLPISSAESFTASKARQAITVNAGDALPKNPVIFATPTYLYAAGLFADASGNLQQQLTRYTVEVAEASPTPIVTFTQDKSFSINLPVAIYGYAYKIRSCNGATSNPLFMSFLAPQNKHYFVNIDVDYHAITPYDTTLLNGLVGLDFVPQYPGYTAAGLLGTTSGNEVWQLSYTGPSACSVTKVWPVAAVPR